MATESIHRPARHAVPDPGEAALVVAAPPQLPENPPSGSGSAMIMMPIVAGGGSLLLTITMGNRPLYAAAGMMFMVASVAVGIVMFVAQHNGPRKRIREQRERYLDYLDQLRHTVRTVTAAQRAASAFAHPPPALLPGIVRLPARRWERRPGDPDFLRLRLGVGDRPLSRPLSMQIDRSSPLIEYDPVCLGTAEQLVGHHAQVTGEPLVLPLAGAGVVSIIGDRRAGRAVARSLIAQLVAFTAPDDARVAVVRHPRLMAEWDWLKWLPHNSFEEVADGPLRARLTASNPIELADLLEQELAQRSVEWQRRRGAPPGPGTRRLVIVLDGEHQATLAGLAAEPPVPSLAALGVHLIVLLGDRREEPETVDVRLTVTADGLLTEDAESAERTGSAPLHGVADLSGPGLLTELARELAPLRLADTDTGDVLHTTIGLPEILGVPDVAALDPAEGWRPRPMNDFLRVPVGAGPAGTPVLLDLKESAFGGMGPHGLVVGATGSGKSEMLRTLVAALAIAHPPDRLALLLVDFKGGATFADTDPLPHCAGLITNLADDATLVERFREALYGELTRRQQLLKDHGNLPNVHAYERLRESAALPPLPHLLVIIDEFSELLTAHPDFAELFVAVGRIGRSIGVHLLLATQRLEAGRIRGLESHLSYRIGLRTFSEAESREALGVPDAYHLPPEPGSGYLKVDTSVFERFKAAMVSQPYRPPVRDAVGSRPILPLISGNGLAGLIATEAADAEESNAAARTTLQVVVDRLAGAGADRVRPVWLPPLPPALPLDAVLDLLPAEKPDATELIGVLGLADIPREQRQEVITWDFTGGDGNVIVLGGPQTGKSTLLRTLVAGLAWRYPPGRVAVFGVDFGGGTLAPLAALPHVAGIATRSDPERVERVLTDLRGLLDEREDLFRRLGLDGPAALRRARAAGTVPASVYGDVFLLVDGWSALREAHDEAEEALIDIAARGPAFGVHTVLTAPASTQVRAKLQASFGGRIELRLTDPFDSVIGRKAAEMLPRDVPGRILLPGERLGHVALPRVDGRADVDDLTDGLADLIERAKTRWPTAPVAPVRVLPAHVTLDELTRTKPDGLVLGISERDLEPALLDGGDPHLVIFGDPQTGKTALLRSLLKQITARPAGDVGVLLVDYRRHHLGVVGGDHLLAYCSSAAHTQQAAAALAAQLRERLPGPDVTPQQLRDRSWWKGLEVYVVVDDLDLVTGRQANPLAPLLEFLPQAADIGLHLITARRTGGAARAVYEPLLQSLIEMSSPGLLLSGDRMEGRLLHGTAPRRLPPGRAVLAQRGRPPEQVQLAWTDPVA